MKSEQAFKMYTTIYTTYYIVCVRYFAGEDTAKQAKAAHTRGLEKMEETLHILKNQSLTKELLKKVLCIKK